MVRGPEEDNLAYGMARLHLIPRPTMQQQVSEDRSAVGLGTAKSANPSYDGRAASCVVSPILGNEIPH